MRIAIFFHDFKIWGLGKMILYTDWSWKGKTKKLQSHTHFQTLFLFLDTPTHHTRFLGLPLLICLLQAWLTSGGYKFDLYLKYMYICAKWHIMQTLHIAHFQNEASRNLVMYILYVRLKRSVNNLYIAMPTSWHAYEQITPKSCPTTFELYVTSLVDLGSS